MHKNSLFYEEKKITHTAFSLYVMSKSKKKRNSDKNKKWTWQSCSVPTNTVELLQYIESCANLTLQNIFKASMNGVGQQQYNDKQYIEKQNCMKKQQNSVELQTITPTNHN